MQAVRWWFAVSMSLVGFALTWAVAAYANLDTQSAVGIAAVAAASILTPLGWWATQAVPVRQFNSPPARPLPIGPADPGNDLRPVGPQVVVGDIPGEGVAWQQRDHLVDRLATVAAGGRPAVVCAVTGQRGIGKTQLAAGYARQRVAQGWPVVVWVLADTELGVLTGLAQLAAAAGVRQPGADVQASAVAALEWLRVRPGPCLLVFDNAVDPDLIRRFTPAVGAVQTVVTTTDLRFASVGVTVEVDLFSEAEAVAYLRERTGLADDEGALVVAEQLGRLPVALSQAGAVIGRGRQFPSYPSYLDRLDRLPITELLPRQPGDPYPRGAAEAILISLDDLDRADPAGAARRLLDQLAVLAPSGVDPVLLDRLAAQSQRPGRRWFGRRRTPGPDDASALAAFLAQRSLSLPTLDQDRTIVHRLIQRVIRDRIQQSGGLDATIISAADTVRAAARDASLYWQNRSRLTEYTEHATALLAHPSGDTARRQVVQLTGALLVMNNDAHNWATSIAIGPALVADSERVLGTDHPDTMNSRNNLAAAYDTVGRLDEAIRLYIRTLADSERVLGPDHPDSLNSRNNLACTYQAAGRLDEAIELHTRTLADRERVLGPDHPNTLNSRNNLAHAYRVAGRLDEALELHTRTLADRERVLGTNHPDTLNSRNNLAYAYRVAGRLDEAIELHTRTLADRERILGTDHPNTLTSRNNLADAYQEVGRLDEAIDLYTRNLADCERVLGPDHPDTLTSRNNLAHAYQTAGRTAEAEALRENPRKQP